MLGGTVLLLLLGGLVAWSAPAALAPVWSAHRNTDARFPYALAHGHDALPAIGTGIFTRMVRAVRAGGVVQLTDPFSDPVFSRATATEAAEIGDREYIRERFGGPPDHVLALTFDDGPSADATPQLLDVLARNQVPATFFSTGRNVLKNAEIFRRLVREGHAAGIHTFSVEEAKMRMAEGWEFIAVISLLRFMMDGAKRVLVGLTASMTFRQFSTVASKNSFDRFLG